MSKLINCPKGPAGEYSSFAMSFYEGCTEEKCDYCYMCAMSKRFGTYFGVSRLKEWLGNEDNAFEIFKKEVKRNLSKLQKNGLFFNFSSDPFLPESIKLNVKAFYFCELYDVPVYSLTKQAWWVYRYADQLNSVAIPKNVRVGFTLTGCDDRERGAASNAERIAAALSLHNYGFKTYGSFEPIIDFNKTLEMIEATKDVLDHFKIGLLSGSKPNFEEVRAFLDEVFELVPDKPIYLKESILKAAGVSRDSIDLPSNCVTRDFNL